MIARGPEWAIDAAEYAFAAVLHLVHLAMHRRGRAHHLTSKSLPDRLMPEAYADQRDGRGGLVDQVNADAGVLRGAGAGGEDDGVRLGRQHLIRRDLVVAMHEHVRAQCSEIEEQIEREAVVVVDQD